MKIHICVPCMDDMATVFVKSLVNLKQVGNVSFDFEACSLVYASRDNLARRAAKSGADWVLWLDSDMTFPPPLLVDMLESAKGKDFLTAVCHMRRAPYRPTLYKSIRLGLTEDERSEEHYDHYPKDGLFQVDGCGLACCLTSGDMLRAMVEKGSLFSPLPGYGEDISFCIRARRMGYELWCDPRIQPGHRAETIVTGETFLNYQRMIGEVE